MPYNRTHPTSVLENNCAFLYWDRSIITDKYIDITTPHDDNLVKTEKEKLSKYLDLAHEITAMWNVNATIIVPIVVTVNGLIAKTSTNILRGLALPCPTLRRQFFLYF